MEGAVCHSDGFKRTTCRSQLLPSALRLWDTKLRTSDLLSGTSMNHLTGLRILYRGPGLITPLPSLKLYTSQLCSLLLSYLYVPQKFWHAIKNYSKSCSRTSLTLFFTSLNQVFFNPWYFQITYSRGHISKDICSLNVTQTQCRFMNVNSFLLSYAGIMESFNSPRSNLLSLLSELSSLPMANRVNINPHGRNTLVLWDGPGNGLRKRAEIYFDTNVGYSEI